MKKVLKILAVIVIFLVIAAAIAWYGFIRPEPPPISAEDRALIDVMPLPAELDLKEGYFSLEGGFDYRMPTISSSRLKKAADRFYSRVGIITQSSISPSGKVKLILDCKNETGDYPGLDDDESYSLHVTSYKIVISAPMENGILHGLETLLQFVKHKDGKWIIPALKTNDHPRFPWRGLMIDACRHWIPKDVILRNLDAMAAVKMNVLHWHLTEYQGFRVESKVFPKLHEMGSNGNYYSQEDIKEVIDYASDRGIRVVPEFDLPGHSTSWFVGYPELASAPGPYVLDTIFGILDPVMDPTREEVYVFLDAFFEEMASLFPDDYVHIGGDEVKATHWEENEEINKFMNENGINDHHELQAYFNQRLHKLVLKYNKKMMGWDEILHPALPKEDLAVQSWRNHKSLWDAARMGSKAVLSAGYYLDHKQSAAFHYKVDPMVIPGAVTIDIDSSNWKGWDCKMYLRDTEFENSLYLFGADGYQNGIIRFMESASGFSEVDTGEGRIVFSHDSPFGEIKYTLQEKGDSIFGEAGISLFKLIIKGARSGGSDMTGGKSLPLFDKIEPLTKEQENNILGGEACMWSEMVDGRTMESRIWPRAGTIAEKLWSPAVLTADQQDMYRRLQTMDDVLKNIGIRHKESGTEILSALVDKEYFEPFSTLLSVLQEDVLFNRMQIYDPELYTTTPLERIVDAARPESFVGYNFNTAVDKWIIEKDEASKVYIEKSLKEWEGIYDRISPAFAINQRLREVEQHAIYLSKLAKWTLASFMNPDVIEENEEEINALLEKSATPYGGTVLSVSGGFNKLLSGTP